MADLNLSLACWNYDRCQALLDGRILIKGVNLDVCIEYPTEIFTRAFTEAPFDICELSASSYILQVARGYCEYIAIPIFVSRAFRHGGIYVRDGAGINMPKDLEGKIVGIPEYQMTMGLWVRGILQDEYGVNFRKISYRTGGTNKAGRKERLPISLPSHMDVQPIGEYETINDLLISGQLDAIISPTTPAGFIAGDGSIRRLFADPVAEERAYFERTRLFPIMHVIGIRRSIINANPDLASAIFNAFVSSRRLAMSMLKETATASANRLHLPWAAAEWEATCILMGDEFWPYGVAENFQDINTLCRYSEEQYLSPKRLSVEDLFVSETLKLPGI